MESHDASRSSSWAPKRILVVDDDPEFLEVLSDVLRAGGHSVIATDRAASALAMVTDAPDFDLLISDLSMPGMDGISLIHRMQQRFRGLPAILLTGLADDGVADTLGRMLDGRYAVLCKPVEARQLLERIAEMLDINGAH